MKVVCFLFRYEDIFGDNDSLIMAITNDVIDRRQPISSQISQQPQEEAVASATRATRGNTSISGTVRALSPGEDEATSGAATVAGAPARQATIERLDSYSSSPITGGTASSSSSSSSSISNSR